MYVSNLDKKIDETKKPRTVPTICSWSDLLGFSAPYVESDWQPNETQYSKIACRLRNANIICARNLNPIWENAIISNDAFMRNLNIERITHLDCFSMWFRSLVYFHMQTNSFEKDNALPGIRTVVAGGERLIYGFENVQYADYVYNYTKPDPEGLSSYPQSVRDEMVMYNPSSFQMNTAFSKSYILDDMGSRYGLSGNAFFIEESTFYIIKKCMKAMGVPENCYVEEETKTGKKIYIKKQNDNWYYMGFELSKPIPIKSPKITTTVYKLLYYYPWDEDPAEFKIDLSDDMPFVLNPL